MNQQPDPSKNSRPSGVVADRIFLAILAATFGVLLFLRARSRMEWIWTGLVNSCTLAALAMNLSRGFFSTEPRRPMTRRRKIALAFLIPLAVVGMIGSFWSMNTRHHDEDREREAKDRQWEAQNRQWEEKRQAETRSNPFYSESLSGGGSYYPLSRRIWLYGDKITDASLAGLKEAPRARIVEIDHCSVTPAGLRALAAMPELREVKLAGMPHLGGAAIDEIAKLPRLERLVLNELPELSEGALTRLKPLQQLKSLEIEIPYDSANRLTDAGMAHLAALGALEVLRIPSADLTDAAMPPLGNLANLRELHITAYNISPAALGALKRMPKLEFLNLRAKFTSETVALLASLPALRTLDVYGFLPSEPLRQLGGLTRLRDLRIRCGSCTDDDLAALAGNAAIRRFDLAPSPITDAGLAHLAGMPNLEHLDLACAKVTDAGVARLAALTQLRHLNLSHTAITDAALPVLEKLPRLESLTLHSTAITPAALAALKKARPNLDIRHSPPKESK